MLQQREEALTTLEVTEKSQNPGLLVLKFEE